jgi:hypothetical protein
VVSDEARLRRVADRYTSKYDPPFLFTVRDGAFYGEDGEGGAAVVYQVGPTKAFSFGKGKSFSPDALALLASAGGYSLKLVEGVFSEVRTIVGQKSGLCSF